jgi:hypothetical protein
MSRACRGGEVGRRSQAGLVTAVCGARFAAVGPKQMQQYVSPIMLCLVHAAPRPACHAHAENENELEEDTPPLQLVQIRCAGTANSSMLGMSARGRQGIDGQMQLPSASEAGEVVGRCEQHFRARFPAHAFADTGPAKQACDQHPVAARTPAAQRENPRKKVNASPRSPRSPHRSSWLLCPSVCS